LLEVTGTLDTVRKIRTVLETLCSTDHESEAYDLILTIYDLIAVETPLIAEFLLDIDDLMVDYECEEQEKEKSNE